ncbi:hypothetical protein [Herbaspirillum huttiense]|uniref:hypothetical protein n=1 Tax=Herbaspirillum huttiense TaxID=863372 RepID=UPI0031E25AEE
MATANAVTSGANIKQVANVSGKDIAMAAGRSVSLGAVNENFPQQISGGPTWIINHG